MKKSLQNNRNNQTEITDQEKLKSIWLELGFRNITFTDELDFDISEIESVYKDPSEEA